MSDRWVVALCLSSVLGALRPGHVPLMIGVLLVASALMVRRPALLCLGTIALVSSLGGRSLAGLDGVHEGPLVGEVILLTDPTPSLAGVRADARWGGRRIELRADGPSGDALRARLAGVRVTVRGEIGPVAPDAPWLVARHVSGRARVFAVESWRPGGPASGTANALRRTLERGAASLSPTARSLYTGLVIGDDRAQPAPLADDFRGAGLTHLLAVSGQNVAFVLAAVGPILRRLRLWPRLALTLVVIGMFGVVTRFEPSVLRAAAMATLATTLVTIGGPASRLRVLCLAVTALLVVDPLLVRSIGFQLSAAATGAIVLLAPRLVGVLPGPVAVREALAVTIAAQLGVAPALLVVFGPLPVASLVANLLAVPVAGLVMVWGLTGGLLAGVLGGEVAAVLHVPTRLALMWVAEVAHRAAALPLGQLGTRHVAALAAGFGLAMWARPPVARLGRALALGAVSTAVLTAQAPAPLRAQLGAGIVRWHHGSTEVIVIGGAGGRTILSAATALAALREVGVGSIDLLVVADASVPSHVAPTIEARHAIGAVVVAGGADPPLVQAPVAISPRPSAVVQVGSLDVRFTATADRLVVEASPRGPPEVAVGAPR
ncbi:MAG: ComEC/Rec2 family competence protein [Microthrixaceae bacterium]